MTPIYDALADRWGPGLTDALTPAPVLPPLPRRVPGAALGDDAPTVHLTPIGDTHG